MSPLLLRMRTRSTLKNASIWLGIAPIEDVARASHCAMLFVLAENEELFDNKDHGLKAYERATGPKKLVVIPKIKHYGIYREARNQAQQLAIAWYDAHLKGPAD
jgi:uncharacterized protein